MKRGSQIARCALLAWAVACPGCGDSAHLGYVSGKIEYGGKAVPAGNKVFFEGSGYLAAAEIQEDGAYKLNYMGSSEIPVGEYVVFVGPPTSNMSEAEFYALKQKVAAEYRQRGEAPPPSPDWVLPAKYYSSATSPLSEAVEPGENVIDIVLEE